MRPDPKPKHKPKCKSNGTDPKYLAWLREQQCANCWMMPPCDPAHQRILGRGGIGIKPPDSDALPLCRNCHAKEHMGAVTFWGQGTKELTRVYVQMLCDWSLKKYQEEQCKQK